MPAKVLPESIDRRAYSVRGLANWILDYGAGFEHRISNMSLNKLIFFCGGKSLA